MFPYVWYLCSSQVGMLFHIKWNTVPHEKAMFLSFLNGLQTLACRSLWVNTKQCNSTQTIHDIRCCKSVKSSSRLSQLNTCMRFEVCTTSIWSLFFTYARYLPKVRL